MIQKISAAVNALTLILILTGTSVWAETTTITVEGMHCRACEKIITKNVCESDKIKTTYESCSVKITDKDKQVGQVVLNSKKDIKIDIKSVKEAIQSAGTEYKIIKEDVK